MNFILGCSLVCAFIAALEFGILASTVGIFAVLPAKRYRERMSLLVVMLVASLGFIFFFGVYFHITDERRGYFSGFFTGAFALFILLSAVYMYFSIRRKNPSPY